MPWLLKKGSRARDQPSECGLSAPVITHPITWWSLWSYDSYPKDLRPRLPCQRDSTLDALHHTDRFYSAASWGLTVTRAPLRREGVSWLAIQPPGTTSPWWCQAANSCGAVAKNGMSKHRLVTGALNSAPLRLCHLISLVLPPRSTHMPSPNRYPPLLWGYPKNPLFNPPPPSAAGYPWYSLSSVARQWPSDLPPCTLVLSSLTLCTLIVFKA